MIWGGLAIRDAAGKVSRGRRLFFQLAVGKMGYPVGGGAVSGVTTKAVIRAADSEELNSDNISKFIQKEPPLFPPPAKAGVQLKSLEKENIQAMMTAACSL